MQRSTREHGHFHLGLSLFLLMRPCIDVLLLVLTIRFLVVRELAAHQSLSWLQGRCPLGACECDCLAKR